jgi:hypothetical protein
MAKNDTRPDYVKISTFLLISEDEDRINERVRGVVFNKFMTLLNYDLKSTKNIDIKLPHCWYRWGDEVVKYYFRPYTKWDHEELGTTTVTRKGNVPEIKMSDPTITEIRNFIQKYIEDYSDDDGWERAIDKLYEKAPYQFQNEYRKLRENLKEAVRTTFIQDNFSNLLLSLFNNAMETFPREFSCMTKERTAFTAVFRAALRNNVSIEEIREMSEEFWFLFCYHLRVDKKCHENISNETLNVWKSSIPWEEELYSRSLQDHAFNLGLMGKDRTIDSILRDRETRVKEFDDLLEEFKATGVTTEREQ